jgi:putative redox protein
LLTCGKDNLAAKRIAATLAQRGIAVLRFDFTGRGMSEGEFARTDFSSDHFRGRSMPLNTLTWRGR